MAEFLEEDVRRTYRILQHAGETEVRVIYDGSAKSVFVKSEDEFVKTCAEYNGGPRVYVGLNEREIGGKRKDAVRFFGCFIIDIDPVRHKTEEDGLHDSKWLKHQPATDTEVETSRQLAAKVKAYLAEIDAEVAMEQETGNGVQLWLTFADRIPVTEENLPTLSANLKYFGKKLAMRAGCDERGVHPGGATIDLAVYELARIAKVPGTISTKGENNPHRPHRIAKITAYNGVVKNEKLREAFRVPPPKEEPKPNEPPKEVKGGDILSILEHANRDEKFRELTLGKTLGFPSRSEAEQALVCKLVYYNATQDQIMEYMRTANPIGKWNEAHETYRELTYKKALEYTPDRYVPPPEVRLTMIKTLARREDGRSDIVEQYRYTDANIVLERHRWKPKKIENDDGSRRTEMVKVIEETEVLVGRLDILSKVEFEALEDEKISKWHIQFKGVDFVGDIDEILEYLYFNANVLCTKDEMRRVLAHIISTIPNLRTDMVFPAVGIFYDHETDKVTLAMDGTAVHPTTDSQEVFFKMFTHAMDNANLDDINEVAQETVNFIDAMPGINKYSALIARGYCCIAPLAYVIKESRINVFPYMYLYGSKGSSKTQIATTAATYVFGEREVLASDAVESAFRLGTEFTATTFPRVIDEAHDVFQKNISIFKSGATSTLATKRGNKDKTLDRYSAFCSFIFTSNMMPISVEEDLQGAVMDRVLVVECESGRDFDKSKYQKAMGLLIRKAPVFGKFLISYLGRLVQKEGGVEQLVKEILEIADIFSDIDEKITMRRAYCLAEAVMGIKIYARILEECGVVFPYPHLMVDDRALCEMVYAKIQQAIKNEEHMNLVNFMQWAITMAIGDDRRASEAGIHLAPARTVQIPDETREKLMVTRQRTDVLITVNAFAMFRKTQGIENRPFTMLPELKKSLEKFGCYSSISNYKDRNLNQHWALKLEIEEYEKAAEVLNE